MAQQRQGSEEAGRVGIQGLKARITDGHRVSSFSGPQQIISRGMLCGFCQHVRLSNTSVCQEQWRDDKGTRAGIPATTTIAVNCKARATWNNRERDGYWVASSRHKAHPQGIWPKSFSISILSDPVRQLCCKQFCESACAYEL